MPIISGGSGGSSQPFDSVTIHKTAGGRALDATTASNPDAEVAIDIESTGRTTLSLAAGTGVTGRSRLVLSDDDFDGSIDLDTELGSVLYPRSTSAEGDPLIAFGLAATALRILRDGFLVLRVHAAPSDAALAAGNCALWFDQTNGAGNTKLMIKGKSADGTVKTASIVLA